MLILFEQMRDNISPKQIIQPMVSLGMPVEIFKGRQNKWALKMESEESARDAVVILQKNIALVQQFYGTSVQIMYSTTLPTDTHFVSKQVNGRAEA